MYNKKFTCKTLCTFLVAFMLISALAVCIQPAAYAQEASNTTPSVEFNDAFDETDVLVAVALHVRCEPLLDKRVRPAVITPLYDLSDNVIAYDVTMSDGSYLIVNANKDNPMIIEFAESRIQNIRSDKKKYYLAPGIILEKESNDGQEMKLVNTQYRVSSQSAELLELQTAFSSVLNTPNDTLARQHSATKVQLENYVQSTKDKEKDEYDFLISSENMPSGTYEEDLIPDILSIRPFGTTSEFDGVNGADNHCAATSAFNMVLYYRYRMGNPIASDDREDVFTDIHERVGNGPVTPLQYRNRIKRYIENDTSYNITVSNLTDTWTNYKNEISGDRMTVMCVWPALFSAHMINGVGTREYSSGTNYCVVLNNWYSQSVVYTVFGTELYDLSKIHIYS